MTKLAVSKIEFSQEMHSCGDTDREASISLRVCDAGAGPYMVINAVEWSVEDHAEVDRLADEMHSFLAGMKAPQKAPVDRMVEEGPSVLVASRNGEGDVGALDGAPMNPFESAKRLYEYEQFVASMWQHNNTMTQTQQKHHAGLGLAEEAGEVVGLLKKAHNGNPLSLDALANEAGDVLFYLATELRLHRLTLADAMRANIEKLKKRLEQGSLVDLSKRGLDAKGGEKAHDHAQ